MAEQDVSPPLSDRTREGTPNSTVAFLNKCSTDSARLLVYIASQECDQSGEAIYAVVNRESPANEAMVTINMPK